MRIRRSLGVDAADVDAPIGTTSGWIRGSTGTGRPPVSGPVSGPAGGEGLTVLLVDGTRDASAATDNRATVAPPRLTGPGWRRNQLSMAAGSVVPNAWEVTAQAPATCGAAIEVPEDACQPAPGQVDTTLTPGAKKSSDGDEFDTDQTFPA